VTAGTRALAELPGPPRWPLVGNLLQLDFARLHATLERWAARYGPLYRADLGRGAVLVVDRPDLVVQILRDRPDGWRRLRSQQRVIHEMGGVGLFTAEGDDWRRQRRLVMGAFDPGHLHRYVPSLVRVTERLRGRLDAAAREGTPIDLQALLMRYTVDVTAGLAFGVDVNTIETPHDPLQAHLDKIFPMMMKRIVAPIAWWRVLRLPSDRRFERHLAKVHEAVATFFDEARARLDRDPARRANPENLLEAMLVAHDETGATLSQEELVGNVLTVLLAGEDTTANTLCWTLHLLDAHRETWDALVDEVDRVIGHEPVPHAFGSLRDLPTIERAVSESLRLRPVAPFMLMQNNEATTLGDVALPADTTVVCLMRRVPADAAADAPVRAFRIDRDDADASAKTSVPFGAGPRLCPGRYLAMVEMKMVLATIARNYRLVSVTTEDGSPPRERLAFTMAPEGLRMVLAPRGST
jgi:cytochrome P450